jgi:hypothetical protein
MDNIVIPEETLKTKFVVDPSPPQDPPAPPAVPPIVPAPDVQTPEEIEAARVAAAEVTAAAEAARLEALETPPDPTLLTTADPKLVGGLEKILLKSEDELTKEDEEKLEANLELVKAIANKEVPFVQKWMEEEKYLEGATYEDTYEGRVSYVTDRDKVRDKTVLEQYFANNETLKAFKEHVIDNKLPIGSFMARINRPAILDSKVEDVTEVMTDEQRDTITSRNEAIVRTNLNATGVDEITATAKIMLRLNSLLF